MKIAVVGGGTAGYIAATHLSKHFPECELYHIYDSNIPTIGVGEGTIVEFPKWLKNITGLDYEQLSEQYQITKKFGIKFENWGDEHPDYAHNFQPFKEAYAYHISADNIVTLLKNYVSATYLDKRVINFNSNGTKTQLEFSDRTSLTVDLAINATGFPKQLNESHLELKAIPTNAAIIRQAAAVENRNITRSIARPYGWIFTIPLNHRTSYGYIYNSSLNTEEEVTADFDHFMAGENIIPNNKGKQLNFPNFCQRQFFDGSLFTMGNAASFLEPLEATAIASTIDQIKLISLLLNRVFNRKQYQGFSRRDIDLLNNFLIKYTYKLSLFVGWHYAQSSCFNTEFWQMAKQQFERELLQTEFPQVIEEFNSYIDRGHIMPNPLSQEQDFMNIIKNDYLINALDTTDIVNQKHKLNKTFGQWEVASFAQIGYGIGYYPQAS